jgi:hypothetical protein
MSESAEEMYKKYFGRKDFNLFEWRILKYVCEIPVKYGSFNEIEMLVRTNLRGYLIKTYLKTILKAKEKPSMNISWISF